MNYFHTFFLPSYLISLFPRSFYQFLGMVKVGGKTSTILIALQSFFNLAPSGSSADSNGICIIKAMTESQRQGATFLFQGVVALVLVFVFVLHNVLHGLRIPGFLSPPQNQCYFISAVRFVTMIFISLGKSSLCLLLPAISIFTFAVLIPLKMLNCVTIENKFVWFFDATIEVYIFFIE